MTRIRVGIIGLGAWGWNVGRCFYELPDCDLVACCDLGEARRGMAEKHWPGVKTFATADEMLMKSEIDAAVVSTPAVTHYPLVRKALLADLDVFVEKPFTLRVKHAEELASLSEVRSLILMVGHLLEYHPVVEELRNLIRSGELGDVYYIYTQRVNLGRIRGDENALWSFAPHDISQILYMLGMEPVDVSARGQSFIQHEIEDVVFLSLFFENRIMAHIHISWLDPHKTRTTTIVGSKKMAVFDDTAATEKLRIYDSRAMLQQAQSYGEAIQVRFGEIRIPRVSTAEPLKIECQHFLDCVANRMTPRSNAMDGLRVVRILEAAQESLKQDGIPVQLRGEDELITTSERTNRCWSAVRV